MRPISKQFGNNMKRIRLDKKMTQGDIVRKAKMDRGYVSSLESGKRNPTLANIGKIAKALGIPARDLLNE
ncbi:MAG TPA: helix-turn-helix transcriptional regulator [Candidatus Paceibacterota bacterium]